MSRGLGSLQREILSVLQSNTDGSTGCRCWSRCPELGSDVHDLQTVLWHLAVKHGRIYGHGYVCSSFQASFSRAVRRLVEGGYLIDYRHGRYRRYVRFTPGHLSALLARQQPSGTTPKC